MVDLSMNKEKDVYSWVRENGLLFPISKDFKTIPTIKKGVYEIVLDPMSKRPALSQIMEDKFSFPFKVYDLDIRPFMNKVIGVWNSEHYKKLHNNLGIALIGTKGSGKTITAKLISNELGLPTIMIREFFPGMLHFLEFITFDCVIILDEAEKVFNNNGFPGDNNSQELLKIIDGVNSRGRKLFILTMNNKDTDSNIWGRPGRVRYIKYFDHISEEAVLEYLKDSPLGEDCYKPITELMSRLDTSTIDTLESIVEEIIINEGLPQEEDFKCLNLEFKPREVKYIYIRNKDLIKKPDLREKVDEFIKKYNTNNIPLDSWLFEDTNIIPLPESEKYDGYTIIEYMSRKFSCYENETKINCFNKAKIGSEFIRGCGKVLDIKDNWLITEDSSIKLIYDKISYTERNNEPKIIKCYDRTCMPE